MKPWPLLLLGIGACADPPRRPAVTYVPIPRAAEVAAEAATPAPADKAAPDKDTGTSTSLVAVSTAEPPAEESCFKKAANGCCGDVGHPPTKKAGKNVCPAGMAFRKSCKGVGPKCK